MNGRAEGCSQVESQIGRGSTFTVQLPFTVAGHAKFDESIEDNLEEMLRPQRQEMQRAIERSLPTAAQAGDR